MKFHRQKGNADMICTGVMRMTKFSMGLEIYYLVFHTPRDVNLATWIIMLDDGRW